MAHGLDKYYTPLKEVNEYCTHLETILGGFQGLEIIEPSAGDGRWCREIEKRGGKVQGYDISPDVLTIQEADFLKLTLPDKIVPRVFVGNPPFGTRGGLIPKFFNKCASLDADIIAMVLPISTGVKLQSRSRLDVRYSLYSTKEMDKYSHFQTITGEDYAGANTLRCTFMVWVKEDRYEVVAPISEHYKILRPKNNKILDCDGIEREQGVGNIGADFSIITHGTRLGTTLDFCPEHKVSVKQFITVTEKSRVNYWRDVFDNTDFSYFGDTNLMQRSINGDEMRCCVEGVAPYKLQILSDTNYIINIKGEKDEDK